MKFHSAFHLSLTLQSVQSSIQHYRHHSQLQNLSKPSLVQHSPKGVSVPFLLAFHLQTLLMLANFPAGSSSWINESTVSAVEIRIESKSLVEILAENFPSQCACHLSTLKMKSIMQTLLKFRFESLIFAYRGNAIRNFRLKTHLTHKILCHEGHIALTFPNMMLLQSSTL